MINARRPGSLGNKRAMKDDKLETGFAGRCKTVDKNRWVKAAQAKNMKLNQWMIEAANKLAEEEGW